MRGGSRSAGTLLQPTAPVCLALAAHGKCGAGQPHPGGPKAKRPSETLVTGPTTKCKPGTTGTSGEVEFVGAICSLVELALPIKERSGQKSNRRMCSKESPFRFNGTSQTDTSMMTLRTGR